MTYEYFIEEDRIVERDSNGHETTYLEVGDYVVDVFDMKMGLQEVVGFQAHDTGPDDAYGISIAVPGGKAFPLGWIIDL